jgi:hypothetical protein
MKNVEMIEQKRFRAELKRALKEATCAAKELFAPDFFEERGYVDLASYGYDVLAKIGEVKLPDTCNDETSKAVKNRIGSIMAKARANYNWEDPRLEELPDVV